MAYTPFSHEQFNYSNAIHEKNKDLIYPYVYGVSKEHISYGDGTSDKDIEQFQDFQEGRDCTFEVMHPGWKYCAKHTSQYRFRDAQDYQRYQDLTITLTNPKSGLPGELFKLLAELFVYGYHHKPTDRLVETLVADCPRMRNGILNGTLPYTIGGINTRSKQPFIAVQFDDLKKQGMVLLHWKVINGKEKRIRTTIDTPLLKAV